MTPAAGPTRRSSLSVSRPNQKLVTHGFKSRLTLALVWRARPRALETAFSSAPVMGLLPVKLVVEFASLVLQDGIPLPLCPVATVELLLCLHVDKSVHTPGQAPTWHPFEAFFFFFFS